MWKVSRFLKRFSAECYGIRCYMDIEGVIHFDAYYVLDGRVVGKTTSSRITVEQSLELLRKFNK